MTSRTSTQAKHTPGPLHVRAASQKSDGGTDYAIVDQDNKVIGEAFEVVGTDNKRPAYANAKLWAASSELLEALEAVRAKDAENCRVVARIRGLQSIPSPLPMEQVDAAIAKAKGADPVEWDPDFQVKEKQCKTP